MKKVICTKIFDGILENRIIDSVEIDVKDVYQAKEDNLAITNGKPYCILVNSGKYTTISKEALELSASPDFKQNTIAKALLIQELPHRIVGNFYMRFKKPAIKTKIFTDRAKALIWLKGELKKSSKAVLAD